MQGLLKVTPEKLLSSSEEFGGCAQQMSSLTQEMMNMVRSLNSIWQGEASGAYGNKFNSLQSDMDKLYRMVTEHSQDLSEMAQSYQQAETTNTEKGHSMTSNVII